MSTQIRCYNPRCKAALTRPNGPFTKCSYCTTDFFVFCHEFPFKLFERNQCSQCPNNLYYFFCFKCNEVMCYNKYRMGSISTCKNCGFNGCYVVCNSCKKPQCFPPTQRYEGVAWKCQFCEKPFNFMTCDACYHQIYRPNFAENQTFVCENRRCSRGLVVRKCQGCGFIFLDSQGRARCDACADQPQTSFPRTGSSIPSTNPFQNSIVNQPHLPFSNEGAMFSYNPVFSGLASQPFFSGLNQHQAFYQPNPMPFVQPQSIVPFPGIMSQGTMTGTLPTIPLMPRQMEFQKQQTIVNNPFGANKTFIQPGYTMTENQFQARGTMGARDTMQYAKEPAKGYNIQVPNGVGGGSSSSVGPSFVSDNAICKICLDKQATYVNNTCFHMSSCSMCVKGLKRTCPICRQTGDFRKVYK